jgi:serine/threonine protein kinase
MNAFLRSTMGFSFSKFHRSGDEYEMGRELGKGACGQVFLAQDKRTGENVAVKVLFQAGTAKDQKSFFREISVPARVNLPGIVRFLGFRCPEEARPGPVLTATSLPCPG